MSRIREWLFSIRHGWHLPTVLAIGLVLFLAVLFSRDPFDLERASGQAVEARITSLSTLGNRYQGKWPGLRVSAETADGIRGITTALPADLRGCKVGDRIEAEQTGLKLYLKPRPCE